MRPHSPSNPLGTTYFEPTNIWHKYGRPPKSKKRRERKEEINETSRVHFNYTLSIVPGFLLGLFRLVFNILTMILLSPIWILSLMSKVFKRVPLLAWLVLLPILVLGLPDTADNSTTSNRPVVAAAAAAVAAGAAIVKRPDNP